MDDYVNVAEPILGDEERENVGDVLDSGRFLMGAHVEEFESKWADHVGVDHAVAVSNGTTAIQLALNALGLEPGEEVIVPSLTFGSTATAVVHQAGVPVFADIERDIYTLDPADLERCLTDETRAVMPVHLFGHPAEMDLILDFADDHDLAVVEDAAQAHGATYRGDVVGGIGDVGCFSFYATKNITSAGGGMVTTDDDGVADRVRLLRSHGLEGRDKHVALGYNFRMGELNGAIGTEQVDRLAGFNDRRREISYRLFDELDDIEWLRGGTIRPHVDHAFFWAPFEVRTERVPFGGKELREKLLDHGVETRHRYVEPLYDQPVFADHIGFNSEFPWSVNPNDHDYDLSLPNVESVVGDVIGLPNHPNLDDEDIERLVAAVRAVDEEVAASDAGSV